MGAVPQKATRVLHVIVTDIDDHKPTFKRTLVNTQIMIKEPITWFSFTFILLLIGVKMKWQIMQIVRWPRKGFVILL